MKLLVPNPYPGERGVNSSRGVVQYRVPQAIYQAYRISELVRGVSNPKVLEIGGGLGRTALYAHQLGITDYTIIDIPVSSLAQGYFLGRVLGDSAISLYGDVAPPSELINKVKLLSPNCFIKGSERYDLVVNVDSLTEIGAEAAQLYWSVIQQRADVFLSINHETNEFTVAELIKESSHISQANRMPYWLRRGYVEEVCSFV